MRWPTDKNIQEMHPSLVNIKEIKDSTRTMKKLNFMNGVIGGVTQASHVSSFVGSSLNFDLDENTNKRWKHKIINKHFLLGFSFT